MGVTDALSTAADALGRNPVPLYLVGAAIAVGGGLVGVANALPVPFVNLLLALFLGLAWFFVEPVFGGGFLGTADEALDGETSLSTTWEVGRAHYVDLLLARGIVVGVQLAFGLLVAVVAFLVLAVVLGVSVATVGESADPEAFGRLFGGVAVLVVVGIVGVAWLLQAAVGLFVQFYAAAIVLEDVDFAGSFRRSVGVVRDRPLNVLGYSALVTAVGFVVGLPFLALAVAQQFAPELLGGPTVGLAPSPVELGAYVVAAVLTIALRIAILPALRTYHVAYYRSIT